METGEIWQKLRALVAEALDLDDVTLGPETVAADIEGWDSVAHVEILVSIEQTFGVRFRTGELGELRNVGALVDRIARDSR